MKTAVSLLLSLAVLPSHDLLSAQCPDGAPPPCHRPATIQVDSNALAILPFRTTGPSNDVQWLSEGMVDLLSVSLDGFAGWRTVHPRTVLARATSAAELSDVAGAARVARSTGAATMVLGNAVALGPQLRLHADLYDVASGRRLTSVDAVGTVALPGPVVDSVAVGLARGRLARHPVGGVRSPYEYATTSAPALRVFLLAEQLARQGDFEAAAESLQRTIAIDSTFGLAYYRLYVVSSFSGAPPGGGRFDLTRTIRAALRHSAGLPQRQRDLLAAVDLQHRGLVTEALHRADDLGRHYPDDAEAAYVQGEAYYHLGLFVGEPPARGLAAFERGIQLDPGLLENYNHPVDFRIWMGDTAKAWALVRQGRRIAPRYSVLQALELALRVGLENEPPDAAFGRLGPADTLDVLRRSLLEALRGFDVEPARAVATVDTLAAALADPSAPRATRPQFLLVRATMRMTQGRYRAADSLLAEARALDPSGWLTRATMAVLELSSQHRAGVVRSVARDLGQETDEAARFFALTLHLRAAELDGDTTEASTALRQCPEDLFPEYCAAWRHALAGIAAAAHLVDPALRSALTDALTIVPYTVLATPNVTLRPEPLSHFGVALARAELAAGDLADARHHLLLTSFATGITTERAGAEELLGQIAEQQHDTAAAIRAYRNFTELWKDADPELQPRVAAARAALARLQH